jgi:hypothetical protein
MSREDAQAEADRLNAEPNRKFKVHVAKYGFGNNYFVRRSSARAKYG